MRSVPPGCPAQRAEIRHYQPLGHEPAARGEPIGKRVVVAVRRKPAHRSWSGLFRATRRVSGAWPVALALGGVGASVLFFVLASVADAP